MATPLHTYVYMYTFIKRVAFAGATLYCLTFMPYFIVHKQWFCQMFYCRGQCSVKQQKKNIVVFIAVRCD